ncbi:MAG TPA: BON domain-containing protein [Candidatus Sulfotelmatobacter sp.]|nr:BON domain-containing protein [Candidatus Sulfotelmatobacter sp.]
MVGIHFLRASTLSLSFVLALGVGCSRKADDAKITKGIQERIAIDPETKDSRVDVATKAGRVTLTGSAKTAAAQSRVEQIARAEPGASQVENDIVVSQPETTSFQPVPNAMSGTVPAAPQPPPPPMSVMADAPPAPTPRPVVQPVVVPAGSPIVVRLSNSLSSGTSRTGQTFMGALARPVIIKGRTAFPAGSTVVGTVADAKSRGKLKGEAILDLSLSSITVRGRAHPISTRILENTEKGKGKRTAATTGGGAAAGGLIGGIAGGAKGLGIGALVGGATGLVGGAVTGNKQIELPAESVLTFRLSAPVRIPPPGE